MAQIILTGFSLLKEESRVDIFRQDIVRQRGSRPEILYFSKNTIFFITLNEYGT